MNFNSNSSLQKLPSMTRVQSKTPEVLVVQNLDRVYYNKGPKRKGIKRGKRIWKVVGLLKAPTVNNKNIISPTPLIIPPPIEAKLVSQNKNTLGDFSHSSTNADDEVDTSIAITNFFFADSALHRSRF